jgi:FkbM family methyltransferase
VTSIWPHWWVPSAIWSRRGRAHLKWELRQSRADSADREGHAFQYVHPIVGPFVYHPSDYLSRRLFLYDDFELVELRFAIEQARLGGTLLDVGANIGLYTVACARTAGDRGRVIALEPGPRTFTKLTETCARLGLSNVTALRVAASRTNGTALFTSDHGSRDVHQHLADARSDEDGNRIEVATKRLDDICGPDADGVTLVKLDVEGHEVEALEGAERILANGRARLIVEINPAGLTAAGTSVDRLWDLLSRTHRCDAVLHQDGSVSSSVPSDWPTAGEEQTLNALWYPQ